MSEGVKTIVFAAVALVVLIAAIVSRPRTSVPEIPDEIGKPLFADFKDPAEARELKIVKFDEKLGEFNEFAIAQSQGRWVIPSHANYPADAEAQLKEAATCLIDLQVLEADDITSDHHEEFGVVEPNPEKLKAGDKGVGTLVTMKGAGDKYLAKLVISDKKVVNYPDRRLVRRAGEDRVYAVKLDPSKLSTKFSDWIEKDLLKLNAFDVEQLQLKDYSVTVVMAGDGPRASLSRRFDLTASQESGGSPGWKLDKLVNYRGAEESPGTLADNEELNSTKLDDLKTALDNLEIVDVRKKPKGLSANLRADASLFKDHEGIQSLARLGFIPYQREDGSGEILSANGEVVVRLKDGVEYVLRFGNVQGAEEENSEKLNRYLLVTTQVNEAKFPEPVLEPLPDLPSGEPPAEPKKDDPKKEEGEQKDGEQNEDPADEAKKKEDAKKAAERKKAEVQAARERITKENKRKEDEYKANRKKAEDKVRELNSRFADWYYVISDDVFKKVHLSRVDLVKEKTATLDEGYGVDAFRKLEQGGLKKDSEKKPGGFDPPSFPGAND